MIVINDASRDNTEAAAKKAGAKVVTHKVNSGLGCALRTGFKKAIDSNYSIIITMDADGQHRPEDIKKFIDKIGEGYDFVLGKRDLSKYPIVKKFGNFFLRSMTNMLSSTNLSDTESGFRAFSAGALKKLDLKAERYEIATEIVYEAGRNKLKCCNVPVSSPVYKKGVKIRDGVKNFVYLLKKRY